MIVLGPAARAGMSPQQPLSPNVAALGCVSMLTAMSSAMIYGLLPIFLVTVVGASTASVGLIEGIAEATTSLTKIFSGAASGSAGASRSSCSATPYRR